MRISEFASAYGRKLRRDAGEHLFRQGDQDGSLYLVEAGLLKAYYLSEDGRENIKTFVPENGMIGSLAAGYQGECCSFSLLCMEDCALVSLKFSEVYEASHVDAELLSDIAEFLLGFGIRKELREYELLCLSAEVRYRRLLAQMPELFDRVTQNEIALYLGVTPVGLSRIKSRVASAKK